MRARSPRGENSLVDCRFTCSVAKWPYPHDSHREVQVPVMIIEKHLPLLRSLAILRILQQGPADRESVIRQVRAELGEACYPPAGSTAERRHFEEDIKRLRELGVIMPDARKSKLYRLQSYGAFSPVSLGEAELAALAFLTATFGPSTPNHAAVQSLLQTVRDWLPTAQQQQLATYRHQLQLDLRRRDDTPIDPRVEALIQRAVAEKRLLRFPYLARNRRDEPARLHTVQPWGYFFDTWRGHFYLDAYWLTSDGPFGRYKQERWQKFRPEAMLADGMELLPDRRPPLPPKRPSFRLEYWLSPQIVSSGQVARHFENMQIHESDAQGWLRITATTDDLFRAPRLLLTYGPNCRVVGGAEVRREMEKLVHGLAEMYGVGR